MTLPAEPTAEMLRLFDPHLTMTAISRYRELQRLASGVRTSAPLSDEQVKELAAKAGLRWIDPIPDDDGEPGYPGGFDMSSLDEIRALIGGVNVCDHALPLWAGDTATGPSFWCKHCGSLNLGNGWIATGSLGVKGGSNGYGLAATHEAATPNLESCDRCGKGQTWTTFPGQRCDCGGLYVPNPAAGVQEVPRG